MSRTAYRAMAAVAVFAMMLPATANASRRAGLNGNVFIEDVDDVFAFPQTAVKYKGTASLEYMGAANAGNGVVMVGEGTSVFGVAINRPELNALHLDAGFAPAHTVVDVFAGFKLGKNAAGVRLGIRNGANNVEPDSGDEATDGQLVLKLTGGFSMGGSKTRADLALDIGFISAAKDPGGGETTGSVFNLGLNGRAFMKMENKVDLGIGALIVFGSSTTEPPEGDKLEGSTLAIVVAAGPIYRIAKWSTVTFNAFLGYTSNGTKQGDAETTRGGIFLPGVQIALEHQLFDWLIARSGMNYVFVLASEEVKDASTTSTRQGSFGWDSGVGILIGDKDQFRIDGHLGHGWLTNGPYALSGAGGAMFGAVTGTMKF